MLAIVLIPFSTILAQTSEMPLPNPEQLAWQKMEMTMFLHFGVNTFTDREWGDGKEDPKLFNPSALDCRQWVKTAKDAGFKLMILTAKHHDGFCLWPSKYTEHSVKNSPWKDGKGDVVKEFTETCFEEGMKVGLYLSPWDRHEPKYGTDEYNNHFINQLTELLTQYGTIDEVWFDGACGEGPNGKKQQYDWNRFYETIRKLAPKALIAICGPDIRWVGNESGVARIGESSVKNGKWHPAECDVSIRPGWFYHAAQDEKVKSLEHLMDIYMKSVGRNSVLLLNVPPDKRGLFADPDIQRLSEFGSTIRGLYKNNLAKKGKYKKDKDGIEIEFEQPVSFNFVNIREDISKGERVQSYKIQVMSGNQWQTVASGSVIGNRNLHGIPEVAASKVRLLINKSISEPVITEFEIYKVTPFGKWGSVSIAAHKPCTASNVHPGGTEFGGNKSLDDDMQTRWATSDDTRECWLEVDLLSEQDIAGIKIMEFEPRIQKFRLEYRNGDKEDWKNACSGGKAGLEFQKDFPAVRARYIRLHILDASKAPSIWEFHVYPSSKGN